MYFTRLDNDASDDLFVLDYTSDNLTVFLTDSESRLQYEMSTFQGTISQSSEAVFGDFTIPPDGIVDIVVSNNAGRLLM